MDEIRWERVTAMFDELLAGGDPDAVIMREPDEEIRSEVRDLWEQHKCGEKEEFLGASMPFQVLPVFQPGDKLLNRFRIQRMIGSGGMGEVYLAFDERIEERIAIKTIARLLAHSPSIRRRIAAEVQNARRVTHPNVCRIHELFDDGETVFFSMELVDGQLLSEVLAGPLDKSIALMLIRQIAEGLHAAHKTGVVHGDLKPSNIMVANGPEVRAVLMDFGLARAVDFAAMPGGAGFSLQAGTLDYMAPELHTGSLPSIRSDIFAFGKVASALLPKERSWEDCLRPHPEERLGSLDPVIQRLNDQSTRRYWLGGAGLAIAGLIGFDILRTRGVAVKLPNGARVLINGFRAAADLEQVARLARGLFLTGVAQSARIHPLPDEDLLPALKRLQGQPSLPASGSVLDALLAQLRAAFWVEAEVERNGGRISLLMRLLRADTRAALAENSFRDYGTVASAAGEAAKWLRKASGESDTSLRINSADAAEFTSPDPEALSSYYDARAMFAVADIEQAIPLLREALRLDAKFAQAHAMLASCLNGRGDFEEGFHEAERAMQLSSRLPERERTPIEVTYHTFAGNSARAIEAARRNVDFHPDEPRYFNALARNLARSGNASEAINYNRIAVGLAPDDALLRNELVENLAVDCQFEEALKIFDDRPDLAEKAPYCNRGKALALMGLMRYEEASRAYESVPLYVPCWVQTPRILNGDLETAIISLRQAAEHAEVEQKAKDIFEISEFLCGLYFLTDRLELARQQIPNMLELPQVPFSARYLDAVVFWAARTGDNASLAEARRRMAAIASRWPGWDANAWLDHADALISIGEGDSEQAESLLVRSTAFGGSRWSVMDLADFYHSQGNAEAAEAQWRVFDKKRGMFLSEFFPGVLVLGWLNRALAAQSLGDSAGARAHAGRVLDHFGRNNPNLHIVQSAKSVAAHSS